jgi:hypothetical protein
MAKLAGERGLAHWRDLGECRAQGHELALPLHGGPGIALDLRARGRPGFPALRW